MDKEIVESSELLQKSKNEIQCKNENRTQNKQNSQIEKFDSNEVAVKNFLEILIVFAGSLSQLTAGVSSGWTSPTLTYLQSPNSTIPTTSEQAAWIAGASSIGSVIAVIIGVLFMDLVGRRNSIILGLIPVIISWLQIAFAKSVTNIILARIVSGVGTSYSRTLTSVYIAEISQPFYRGRMSTAMNLIHNFGLILAFIVGPLLTIQQFAYTALVLTVIQTILFLWMPESPYYHLMNGQIHKARKQLEKLRGHNQIEEELTRIENGIKTRVSPTVGLKRLLSKRKNRRPFYIISILYISLVLTGKIPLIFFCHELFAKTNSNISSYWSSIIITVVELFAGLISILTIDRAGRRPLLIYSLISCAITLMSFSIYFYYNDQLHYDMSNFNWLPLVSMIVFNGSYNIGLANMAFVLLGEYFASDVKAMAVSLISLLLPIFIVIHMPLYQFAVDNYGIYLPFAFFSVVAVTTALYSYFCVPETKGESLEKIQEIFEKK